MTNDFDERRIATLALEIKQGIPAEGGFLCSERIRPDEVAIQGDRTGLLLFAISVLLRAIDHPAAEEIEERISGFTPGHELIYAWLIGPDEIERLRRRPQHGIIRDLIILIGVLILILGLAVIGAVTVVLWIF